MRRTILALMIALAALAALAPGVASASDASVRSAVRSATSAVKPSARAWSLAVVHYARDHRPAPLRRATQRLGRAVGQARARVARERASSSKVRHGRTLYLRALSKLRAGLRSYDRALAGGGRSALDRAQSQISAADRDGTRAARLIGVTS